MHALHERVLLISVLTSEEPRVQNDRGDDLSARAKSRGTPLKRRQVLCFFRRDAPLVASPKDNWCNWNAPHLWTRVPAFFRADDFEVAEVT
jgi:hypothetical protein